MARVNSNRYNFVEVVEKYLTEYHQECVEAMMTSIREVAKEGAKRIKDSPATPKRTGKYAKGWTYKVETGRIKVGAVVYGKKPTYRTAHLLEHGHAVRRGGRKIGDAEPREHIYPVEQWMIDEAVDRIIQKMEGLA